MRVEELKEKFIKNNINVEKNLVDGFIERFIDILPEYVIEYLANYDRVQKLLLTLSDCECKNLARIINRAIDNNNDWISISSNFVSIITYDEYNKYFKELVDSIKDIELSDEELDNLLFIVGNKRNYYGITNYQDLHNFKMLKQLNVVKPDDEIRDILLKKYGLSFTTANNYLKRFGSNINILPNSKEKDFLIDIKNIIEGKKTSTIEFSDFDFINNLDSNLRNMYVNIYNDTLYKIKDEDFIKEVDGVKVYDAGTDFYLNIYSFGLSNNNPAPENFYDNWNRNNNAIANFCSSIVSPKSMRTSIKHCVYGFSHFESNDLRLLGANDLGTNNYALNDTPNITDFNKSNDEVLIAPVEFRVPEDLIANTRYTNNELYRDRRKLVNGNYEKINPNYIVYFKEKSDINVENDRIWNETLKAAKDFNLPIVIVNVEKCIKKDVEEIESILSRFLNGEHELIKPLIVDIETISYGFNKFNIKDRYFNGDTVSKILNQIFNYINEVGISNQIEALKILSVLDDTINREYDKINKSKYWIHETTGKTEVERAAIIDDAINKSKEQLLARLKEDIDGIKLK